MELKEIIQERLKVLKFDLEQEANFDFNYETEQKIGLLESILEEYKNSPVKTVRNLITKRTPLSMVLEDYNSDLYKSEKNDCTVRAMAAAFGVTYDESHKFMKEVFGREDKKGHQGTAMKLLENPEIFGQKVIPVNKIKNGKFEELKFKQKNGRTTKMSVRRFVEGYGKGTFLVIVREHMFAIKDGVIIGNYSDNQHLRKVVLNAFKIAPMKK